ncbi:MAG TPA: uroporphyrinogen-III synthase [Pinirhizobacter sp.]|uniref:uroporphyrinogen-III synthase n=1 Tax=Pinirhizobacter sp. TaxID=2950432 RepID=UPI002CFE4E89|nr:uroporphyrinogen-III synthase [Pinirhizobacter sp.]HMH68665.1 uroporphyrinogen-III synthase [Pinirhizobacter sp.]
MAITRPAGTAAALVTAVRARGGIPVLLPGLSLRAAEDTRAAATALDHALTADVIVFTSPAAVAHARQLHRLVTRAQVCALGAGTAKALARAGIKDVRFPDREDSEGLLAMDIMSQLGHARVALIGAAGGRGILRSVLRERSARFDEVHVYRRGPARLDARHRDAACAFEQHDHVLLSSAEALANLHRGLAGAPWQALLGATWIVSSERLAAMASQAGIAIVHVASSAQGPALLDMAAHVRD